MGRGREERVNARSEGAGRAEEMKVLGRAGKGRRVRGGKELDQAKR